MWQKDLPREKSDGLVSLGIKALSLLLPVEIPTAQVKVTFTKARLRTPFILVRTPGDGTGRV